MAGWASGFQAGSELGRSLIDTYQRAREQGLIQQARQLQAEEIAGAQLTPEEQARGQSTYQSQMLQGAQSLGLTPEESQEFVARAPAAPTVPQAPTTWRLGDQTMYRQPTQQDITRAQNEMIARAIELRNPIAAAEMRRGLERQEREAETYQYEVGQRPTRERATAASIRAAEAGATSAERGLERQDRETAAQKMIADLIASGQPLNSKTAQTIAQQAGVPQAFVDSQILGRLNLTEAEVKAETAAAVRELSKAATKGDAGLNEFLTSKFDPNPDDGIAPQVVRDKKGRVQIMYGGQPLAGWGTYGDLNELVADAKGRLTGDPLAAAEFVSGQRLRASQIELNKAKAEEALRGPRQPANPYQQRADFLRAQGITLSRDEALAVAGAARPWVQQGPRPMSMTEITNIAKDMVNQPVMTPDGKVRLDENNKPLRHTLRTAIQQVQEDIASGLYGTQTQGSTAPPGGGLPNWGAGMAAPAAAAPARNTGLAPRGPVDLSPVGRVSVAGAPAAASAPSPQVIPGVGTVLSRTSTGLNVDIGNGRTQFIPFAELQRQGIYQY